MINSTNSDLYYAQELMSLKGNELTRWTKFCGQCFLAGVVLDLTLTQISEYIFETRHAFEPPRGQQEVLEDMRRYFGGIPVNKYQP
jgi:hypothetical protein